MAASFERGGAGVARRGASSLVVALLALLLLPRFATAEVVPPPEEGGEAEGRFPYNVTTLYKGGWALSNDTVAEDAKGGLPSSEGVLLMRLSAWNTGASGTHFVEGVAFLRTRDSASEDDVVFVLRGLYSQNVGEIALHAVSYDDGEGLREAAADPDGDGEVGKDAHGVSLCALEGTLRVDEMTEEEEHEEVIEISQGTVGGVEIRVAGRLRSDNCRFGLDVRAATMEMGPYYNKVGNYVLLTIGVTLGEVGLTVKQMQASSSPARAARVSMLTVTMMALLDAAGCMVHLMESVQVSNPLFQAFIAISFFKFFAFSVFELRFLLLVWRARRPDAFNQGWQHLRREFSALYTQYYGAIVLGLVALYQGRDYLHLLVFPLLSFWVPQAVSNAREDTNRALEPQYVLGMGAARLFLPLYLWGCPENFFGFQNVIEYRPVLCALLALWVGAQCAFLLLQDRLHARFFVPARFLPPKYDYHDIELAGLVGAGGEGAGAGGDEEEGGAADRLCVICHDDVDLGGDPRELMRTPCNHLFHTACLSRWMDQKLECPTCRAPLPPL